MAAKKKGDLAIAHVGFTDCPLSSARRPGKRGRGNRVRHYTVMPIRQHHVALSYIYTSVLVICTLLKSPEKSRIMLSTLASCYEKLYISNSY
jgi:hypothetical protein